MRRMPAAIALVSKGGFKIPANVSPLIIDSSRSPVAPSAISS